MRACTRPKYTPEFGFIKNYYTIQTHSYGWPQTAMLGGEERHSKLNLSNSRVKTTTPADSTDEEGFQSKDSMTTGSFLFKRLLQFLSQNLIYAPLCDTPKHSTP